MIDILVHYILMLVQLTLTLIQGHRSVGNLNFHDGCLCKGDECEIL